MNYINQISIGVKRAGQNPGPLLLLFIKLIFLCPSARRLEALSLALLLRRRNRRLAVGIGEAAARLAVLQRRRLGRAHALALAVVGTARAHAVGVGHAAARDELRAVAAANVLGARVVGRHSGHGGDGD